MSITSLMLPQPMKSGEPFSLSADVTNEGYTGTIELLGDDFGVRPRAAKAFQRASRIEVFCAGM